MVDAPLPRAEVAEQADASVSKTDVRKDVRVRLPLSAPRRGKTAAAAREVTGARHSARFREFVRNLVSYASSGSMAAGSLRAMRTASRPALQARVALKVSN